MHESEKVKVKSLSRVRLLAISWTATYQAPPSMGFSRQEYWSGCHCLLWALCVGHWNRLCTPEISQACVVYFFVIYKKLVVLIFMRTREWNQCVEFLWSPREWNICFWKTSSTGDVFISKCLSLFFKILSSFSLVDLFNVSWGFPGGSEGKASVYNAGDPGSIPGLGISPEEGNGTPLQYSCLENPTDGGAW